jgi:hypothetical protein
MFRTKTVLLMFSIFCASGCVENTERIERQRRARVPGCILKSAPNNIQHKVNASLGGKVTLLGYNLKVKNPRPGGVVKVVWFWRVDEDLGRGWRPFTHGFGEKDKDRLKNFDDIGKVRRNLPSSDWKEGMIIRDPQRLKIPPKWKSSFIELKTGFYKGAIRLTGSGRHIEGGNRIVGPRIQLKPRATPKAKARVAAAPQGAGLAIPHTETAPEIDGAFQEEEAWQAALKLSPFVHLMSGQRVEKATDVSAMWDEKNLYIAMRCDDTNIKSGFKKRDDALWYQDAFQILLKPSAEKPDYFELQVSPAGVLFDAHLPRYRESVKAWNSGAKVAVTTEGTLNEETDADKGWAAELAIPLRAFEKAGSAPPKAGDTWTANFFRTDALADATEYSAFSPPRRFDFHTHAHFKGFTFLGPPPAPEPAAEPPDKPKAAPAAEKAAEPPAE